MGVYGKNRPEWVLTDLAAATLGGTTIAFYDTLGPQAIEFVIHQTEL
jgi:long-chain acyl-CoA synthetase